MKPKKIFILLPDGIGLRNFAYTSFIQQGEQMGWDVVFWNQTPFNLTEMGFNEIKLNGKPNAFTDLIKRAKIISELDYYTQKFDDEVYQSYKFSSTNRSIKSKIKNFIISLLIKFHKGKNGLHKLRKKIKDSERKSIFYRNCLEVLRREQPDFIFCTNQRPVNAISPLTAAQDLGIPTGTFIFSWDNLPKATMIVDTDFYFVWSKHMCAELTRYYPFINSNNIFITGTPQFEPHLDLSLRRTREEFFNEYKLDLNLEYVCFSGDDKTTSPNDAYYLQDVAESIKRLNKTREFKIGILFRRCPVDFSNRYDFVLEKYKDLIVPIAPKWIKLGDNWNSVLPTQEDINLQVNTILHSKAVINLGSSMVFDYALFNKPCLYINYDVENSVSSSWSSKKVYNFIHFKSMPTKNEVIWLNSKTEIAEKLNHTLLNSKETVNYAKEWLNKINLHPPQDASFRIWTEIEKILK